MATTPDIQGVLPLSRKRTETPKQSEETSKGHEQERSRRGDPESEGLGWVMAKAVSSYRSAWITGQALSPPEHGACGPGTDGATGLGTWTARLGTSRRAVRRATGVLVCSLALVWPVSCLSLTSVTPCKWVPTATRVPSVGLGKRPSHAGAAGLAGALRA